MRTSVISTDWKSLRYFLGLVVAASLLATAWPARTGQAADLFLSDEAEVYGALDKLNASGVLPGFLANTRPYTLKSVRAAVDEAAKARIDDPFDLEMLQVVARYVGPKVSARMGIEGVHANTRAVPPNGEGIPNTEGWSFRPSVSLREETSPNVSAQLRAKSFFGEGGDEGNRLLDTALESGYDAASVAIGKLSTWYGPGRHGALIFTNNAAPYPGVRLHNATPIRT